MTQQTINIGTSANDKTGDPLRVAFAKVNANFDELYAAGGGGGGANVTESNTPPNAPNVGDLWYDTNGGRMYVFYDHNWVDASPLPNPTVISSLTNSTYTLSVNSDGTITVPENVEISNTSLINVASPVFGIFTTNNWINMDDPGNNLTSAIEFLTSRNVHNFKWTMGSDGTLNIPVTVDGSAIVQATSHIKIISAGKTWSFANDGNLTIPDGGDIRNIHGTSVLGGGTSLPTNAAGALVNDGSGILTWTPFPTDGTGLVYGSRLVFVNGNGSDLVFQTLSTGWGKVTANGTDGFGLKSGNSITIRATDKNWSFNTDGSTTFPNGSKLDGGVPYKFATDNSVTQYIDLRDASGRGFYTDGSGYTLRSIGSKSWIFGTDGSLTVPASGSIKAADSGVVGIQYLQSTGISVAQINGLGSSSLIVQSNNHNFTFGSDGRLTLPVASVPTHSTGASGDKLGMVAFDGNYIYYCTTDYTDGLSDIWVRSAWTSTSW